MQVACLPLLAQQLVGRNTAKSAPSAPDHASLVANYGKLPLSFEKNQGQVDPQVRFISRGNGYSLFLTDSAAVLSLRKPEVPHPLGTAMKPKIPSSLAPKSAASFKTDVVRMELAGASRELHVVGDSQLPGTANYFIGNDPSKWHSAVPTFARVKYDRVYPGVDLVYYGNQSQLEYDFVVAPNADPRPIRLHFVGASKLHIAKNGDLEVIAKNGRIAFHKPVIYQEISGQRKHVEGGFTLLANNIVAFALDNYDHSREVVIDPTLTYSTYLSGTGFYSSNGGQATAIAVDASGNAYVTGTTSSLDFPATSGALQTVGAKGQISAIETYAFVAKFNPDATALIYSTYLDGGACAPQTCAKYYSPDSISGIAVDASGNAFLTGTTYSSDFPVTSGAYQFSHNAASQGNPNGFITKLNPSGSGLVYSTFLGGSGYGNTLNGIAIDSAGNAYVTGSNYSTDFPVTTNAYQATPHTITISKLNPSGSALVYSTYFGGTASAGTARAIFDLANSIQVDSAGNAYVVGQTADTSFPVTTGAYQAINKASASLFLPTGFVAKFNPAGSERVYVTFLGGSGSGAQLTGYGDEVFGVAVDSSGDAYVTGVTGSSDFPTQNAIQTTNKTFSSNSGSTPANPKNAFVTKLNPSGSALIFSTYIGSSSGETMTGAQNIALDSQGNVYLTGTTFGVDFPVTANAVQGKNNSAGHSSIYTSGATSNAFLTELSSAGTLVYSSYFGGSGYSEAAFQGGAASPLGVYAGDFGVGLALDAAGNCYLSGIAQSDDLATTAGAYQSSKTAAQAAYVAKFNLGSAVSSETITTVLSNANPQNPAVAVTFSAHVQSVSGTGVPTGNVGFSVDGGSIASVALNSSGRASYSVSSLTDGSHSIAAAYDGDSNYSASTGQFTQTVDSGASSISALSGSNQSTPVNSSFPLRLVVQVLDANGKPVPDSVVMFSGTGLQFFYDVVSPGQPEPLIAGFDGKATVGVKATAVGSLVAVAKVSGVATPAYFSLNATTAPASVTVVSGATQTTPYASSFAAPLVVLVNDASGNPVSGATVTFAGAGLSFSSTTATTGSNGEASVMATATASGSLTATASVSGVTGTATFSLNATQVPLTITASNVSVAYNQPIPGFTYTATGFVNGDTSAVLSGAPSETTMATQGSAPGPYLIAIGQGTLAATNYTFPSANFVNGTLTITSLGTVAAPTFSVAAGTYSSTQTITISDTTAGVTVFYTTNGTTPTVASTKYTGPITVGSSETLQALAVADGYTNSAIASAVYTINTPTPTLGVVSGSGQNAAYGSAFAAPLVILIKDSNNDPVSGVVVNFIGAGVKFSNSSVTTGSNGEASVTATAIAAGSLTVSATASGATGTVSFSLTATPVALTVAATNVSVPYGQAIPALTYTTTGFVNGDSSSVVTGIPTETTTATQTSQVGIYPVTISQGTLVATNYTFTFVNGTVTIISLGKVSPPLFTPAADTYTSAQSVSISDTTPGATIYYTTDGSTPTSNSTKYMGAITVGSSQTISAVAVASGYTNSTVAMAQYVINLPTPDFSLGLSSAALTLASGQSATVTLTATPANGFSQAITFSCSGLPSNDSCSFSPSTITPSGAPSTTTLTVAESTTAASHTPSAFWPGAPGGTLAMTFCWLGWRRRRKIGPVLFALALMMGMGTFVGCGGGTTSTTSPSKTTYNVTVTATSGSISHATPLTITQ